MLRLNALSLMLETCSWSSLRLRRHVASSRQVLQITSQHHKSGNQRHHTNLTGPKFKPGTQTHNAELSTMAFRGGNNIDNASSNLPEVHLSPKPQRRENVGPPREARPPLAPRRPQGEAQAAELSPRTLALRDRLHFARRKRLEEYKKSAAPQPPPAPSSFDLIVSNRLANSPPTPAPSPAKEKDTFSPLVKAIFDLLDQPVTTKKEPVPSPRVDEVPLVQRDSELHEAYYHRQKHKYRVYEQAFNTGNPRFDTLGRTLCRILRHQATQLGLHIRTNGYVKVDDILKLSIRTHAGIPMNQHSLDELLEVVERDPKQRYSTMVEDGELYVRANQGHSMKAVVSEHLLTEITSPEQVPLCVHGTYKCFLPSIMRTGLNRMSRNHVHFAIGLPNDEGVISGMMDSVEVLIYLDVPKALQDGMKLYISDNKVLLTEGFAGIVPCEYFEKVVEWPSFKALV